jgi:hypothetical protein
MNLNVKDVNDWTTFSRKHYERIAKILKKIPSDPTKDKVVEEMVKAFAEDNPRFNKIVFTMECNGIKPNALAWKMGEKPSERPKPTPNPSGGLQKARVYTWGDKYKSMGSKKTIDI